MWQKLSKMTKNRKIASEFKIFGYFASDIQHYFVVHSGLIHVCLKNSQWMLSGAPINGFELGEMVHILKLMRPFVFMTF